MLELGGDTVLQFALEASEVSSPLQCSISQKSAKGGEVFANVEKLVAVNGQ